MNRSTARISDVALLATLLSSAVTGVLLVLTEVFQYAVDRPFGIPPLISFLLVAVLLLFVTQVMYSKLRQARKESETEGIFWQRLLNAFLTTLIPLLAYLLIRTGKVAQREWLAVFYVSVLFAILIPHLIVRVFDFAMQGVRSGESSQAPRTGQP